MHLEKGVVRGIFSKKPFTGQLEAEGENVALVSMVQHFERIHVAIPQAFHKLIVCPGFQKGAFMVLTAARNLS